MLEIYNVFTVFDNGNIALGITETLLFINGCNNIITTIDLKVLNTVLISYSVFNVLPNYRVPRLVDQGRKRRLR